MTDSFDEPNLRKLSQLVNPYDKPQNELVRAQVWIDPADKYLLTSVFPLRGIETALLAGIYKAVCEQLRKENITSYSPQNARRAQEIVTCYLAAVCSVGQGHIPNVTGGSDSLQQPHPHDANLSADVHKATKGRRGSGSRNSKRSKGKETTRSD